MLCKTEDLPQLFVPHKTVTGLIFKFFNSLKGFLHGLLIFSASLLNRRFSRIALIARIFLSRHLPFAHKIKLDE
jgi:hypothetical protein